MSSPDAASPAPKRLTKTVRSRADREIGQIVEGCTILEKRVIIPPNPRERRMGVYDYLVEVPPQVVKPQGTKKRPPAPAPAQPSFTRATPEEMRGGLIRRLPSR
ncbi:MAG: hypothetical protein KIT09_07715 [Bryobacteraceae bacterium]|nr:hypothetical protein [Bryobacteraceae bacterium]